MKIIHSPYLSFLYMFVQSDELYWGPLPPYIGCVCVGGGVLEEGVLTRSLPTIFPKSLRRIYSLSISIHVISTSCLSDTAVMCSVIDVYSTTLAIKQLLDTGYAFLSVIYLRPDRSEIDCTVWSLFSVALPHPADMHEM